MKSSSHVLLVGFQVSGEAVTVRNKLSELTARRAFLPDAVYMYAQWHSGGWLGFIFYFREKL